MIVRPHICPYTGDRTTLVICPKTGKAALIDPLGSLHAEITNDIADSRATVIWHLHTKVFEEQADPDDAQLVELLRRAGALDAEPIPASWPGEARVARPLPSNRTAEVQVDVDGEVRSMEPLDVTSPDASTPIGIQLGDLEVRVIPRRDSEGDPRLAYCIGDLVLLGSVRSSSIIPELMPGLPGTARKN